MGAIHRPPRCYQQVAFYKPMYTKSIPTNNLFMDEQVNVPVAEVAETTPQAVITDETVSEASPEVVDTEIADAPVEPEEA